MKSKLAKVIRRYFETELTRNYPFFQLVQNKQLISNGNRLYIWTIDQNFICALCINFHDFKNKFTIDIAYRDNRDNKYEKSITGMPIIPKELTDLCFNGRIQHTWGQNNDFWFEMSGENEYAITIVTKEEIAEGRDLIDDAISRIGKYLIPFFQKAAEERGYKID